MRTEESRDINQVKKVLSVKDLNRSEKRVGFTLSCKQNFKVELEENCVVRQDYVTPKCKHVKMVTDSTLIPYVSTVSVFHDPNP